MMQIMVKWRERIGRCGAVSEVSPAARPVQWQTLCGV